MRTPLIPEEGDPKWYFVRNVLRIFEKRKKEKEQVENEVWHLSNHGFYNEEESETILDQKGKPIQK